PQGWSGTPPSWAGVRAQRPAPSPIRNVETVASESRPAPSPGPSSSGPPHRSSRGWFVLAGLVIVVGGAVAVALIVTGGDKASADERQTDKHDAKKQVKDKESSDDDEVDKAMERSIDHTMAKIDQEIDREFD